MVRSERIDIGASTNWALAKAYEPSKVAVTGTKATASIYHGGPLSLLQAKCFQTTGHCQLAATIFTGMSLPNGNRKVLFGLAHLIGHAA